MAAWRLGCVRRALRHHAAVQAPRRAGWHAEHAPATPAVLLSQLMTPEPAVRALYDVHCVRANPARQERLARLRPPRTCMAGCQQARIAFGADVRRAGDSVPVP
jgi:hypothetical protein